ncbi:IS1634 family transposase, partial [Myxococcota bacterium]
MFIRVTRNAAGQAYYHLVESYRIEGKVKQRTLLSLGRVENGKLEALADAISQHTDLLSATELAKNVSIEETYILGPLLVLRGLFASLGIDKALERVQLDHKQLGFSLREAVFQMAAARFVRPCSKLAIYEQLLQVPYPEFVRQQLELQHLYRALDVLQNAKDQIETDLFVHGRDLFSRQVNVVLYDLTTLRFESTRETERLRRFGFSKERRSDCTQVVLGLTVDSEGIPLGFEVFPGNTVETKTLSTIIQKIRSKLSVRRFIFVADRGIISKANLAVIKASGGQFIVGMRIGALDRKRPELFDRSRFTKVAEGLEILETTFGEDRGIVTWSQERAQRDQKTRTDILEKIRKKLAAKSVSAKTFVSNSNYRFFLKGLGRGQKPELDSDKIAQAEKKDGFFALVTNVPDKTPSEVFAQYKELWRIEDTFGELKGTLKARPVFHWTDHRIVGHLTLCFLALLCEAHITRALRAARDSYVGRGVKAGIIKPRQLSAATALRELGEIRAVPVNIGTEILWVRTDINGHAAKLFQTLGLR